MTVKEVKQIAQCLTHSMFQQLKTVIVIPFVYGSLNPNFKLFFVLQIAENGITNYIINREVAGNLVAVVMMFLQILQIKIKLIWKGISKDTNLSFLLILGSKTCVNVPT